MNHPKPTQQLAELTPEETAQVSGGCPVAIAVAVAIAVTIAVLVVLTHD